MNAPISPPVTKGLPLQAGAGDLSLGVSAALRAMNEDLIGTTVRHPFLLALADGTLPEPALVSWAQQCALFCQLEQRALLHLLSLIGPQTDLATLLNKLVGDTVREPAELTGMLTARGAEPPGEEWPVCLGYGSYVQAAAAELPEGLTAVYAVEYAYFRAWASLADRIRPGSEHWHWVSNWSAQDFAEVVAGLGAELDRLTAPATEQLVQRLAPVFRKVLMWEDAFWTMALDSQAWPVPERRP